MLFTRIIKGIALLSLSGIARCDTVTVTSPSGVSYLGVRNTNTNQDVFLGVPYAKPPVGPLRFKPPQAWSPTSNSTVVNATVDRPICIQSTPIDYSLVSEDCLHLSLCELLITEPLIFCTEPYLQGNRATSPQSYQSWFGSVSLLPFSNEVRLVLIISKTGVDS